MSAYVGSRVYQSTKPFKCSHCSEWIPKGATYLRFWLERGERRSVCLLDALSVYTESGQRLYGCPALDEYVAGETFSADELAACMSTAITCLALALNQPHPMIDLCRGFLLGLRRGTIEEINKQQEKKPPCH